MALTVPAACEPLLFNQATASRLAVIIDQLVQLNGGAAGVPPNAEQFGVGGVPVTSADASGADLAITAASAAGEHITLDNLVFSTAAAMNFSLKEETSGTVLFGPIYCAVNSTTVIPFPKTLRVPTVVKKLMIRTSVAGAISVLAAYRSQI